MSARGALPRLRRGALAGALAAVLALGGCGGGGDGDDDDAGDDGGKQAYITQVDRICADQDRISGELARLNTENPDDLTRLGERVVGYLTGGVERIEEIELPDDSRARRDARAYIEALKRSGSPAREFSAGVLALADALRARDKEDERTAVRRIRDATTELAAVEKTTDTLARRFGFQRCGRGVGGAGGGGPSTTSTTPPTQSG